MQRVKQIALYVFHLKSECECINIYVQSNVCLNSFDSVIIIFFFISFDQRENYFIFSTEISMSYPFYMMNIERVNEMKIIESYEKILLTGGPGSPASPFFPFFPRLPGGPGGPMEQDKLQEKWSE